MSAPWYAVTDPRPDAAWELYHENSKRSLHDGIAVPRAPGAAQDYSGLPVFALADRPPTPQATHVATGGGALSLRAFSDLLATGCRGLTEAGAVTAFVAIRVVESLPRGLARYDAVSHNLRIVRGEDAWQHLRQALYTPEVLARAAALILLAADLDATTSAAGERGYREALIAIGQHLAAIETAAQASALRIEPVAYYDREIDALLHLDGLARSVIAVVAVGA